MLPVHSPLRRALCAVLFLSLFSALFGSETQPGERPNILWLTSEDHGPHMGCYGDDFADTPNVDALATKGLRYNRAWSNAPVCAPARTTLITGLYPPSTGAQHMRSFVPAPDGLAPYPVFLREAGYYCTNNVKTDYNIEVPDDLWDESSNSAHWQNRADGQPFFAIFNAFESHESRLRVRPHEAIHDPAEVDVPPYHPDTPEVRQDWAQYYDTVTAADARAGERLAELAAAGLTEDTIVFYYSDHGAGMPSHKRNPNNRGLQVALVVYIPEKFAHLRPDDYVAGGDTDRLVSFVDFAPTLLSLIGIEPPEWMQGHAFLGEHIAPPPAHMFGFRGRMDERTDFVRTVTDGRYVYIRNFRPDLPAGQHVDYQFQTPTTRIWFERFQENRGTDAQRAFWELTPSEELYDLHHDPHEIDNLVGTKEGQAVKDRLSTALCQNLIATRDLGFLPEGEIHRRSAGRSPWDWMRSGRGYDVAHLAAVTGDATIVGKYVRGWHPDVVIARRLADPEPAVRYWTLRGLLWRGGAPASPRLSQITRMLDDVSPDVAIAAAELLARHGDDAQKTEALARLGDWADPAKGTHFITMAALATIDQLGPLVAPLQKQLAGFPRESAKLPHSRYQYDVDKLLASALGTASNDPRLK